MKSSMKLSVVQLGSESTKNQSSLTPLILLISLICTGLHKRAELRATLQQVVLIGLGIASIWGARALLGGA